MLQKGCLFFVRLSLAGSFVYAEKNFANLG